MEVFAKFALEIIHLSPATQRQTKPNLQIGRSIFMAALSQSIYARAESEVFSLRELVELFAVDANALGVEFDQVDRLAPLVLLIIQLLRGTVTTRVSSQKR